MSHASNTHDTGSSLRRQSSYMAKGDAVLSVQPRLTHRGFSATVLLRRLDLRPERSTGAILHDARDRPAASRA